MALQVEEKFLELLLSRQVTCIQRNAQGEIVFESFGFLDSIEYCPDPRLSSRVVCPFCFSEFSPPNLCKPCLNDPSLFFSNSASVCVQSPRSESSRLSRASFGQGCSPPSRISPLSHTESDDAEKVDLIWSTTTFPLYDHDPDDVADVVREALSYSPEEVERVVEACTFERAAPEDRATCHLLDRLHRYGVSASFAYPRPSRVRNLAPLFLKDGTFEEQSYQRALPLINQYISENMKVSDPILPQGRRPLDVHQEKCKGRHPWKDCIYNIDSTRKYHTLCLRCSKKAHFVSMFGICRTCLTRPKPNTYKVDAQMLGSLLGVDVGTANATIHQLSALTANVESKLEAVDSLFASATSNTFLLSVCGFLATCFTDSSTTLRITAFANCIIAFIGYKKTCTFLNENRTKIFTWFCQLCTKYSTQVISYLNYLRSTTPASSGTNTYEVHPQSLAETGIVICSLVASCVACVSMSKVPKNVGADFDIILRRVSSMGGAIKGFSTLYDTIQSGVTQGFAYVCDKLSLPNPLLDTLPSEARTWCEKAIEVITRPMTTSSYDSAYANEVNCVLQQGYKLQGFLTSKRYPLAICNFVNQTVSKVHSKYTSLASLQIEASPRVEPYVVYLCGAPGVGKSGVVSALTSLFCMFDGKPPEEWTRWFYTRKHETEYWDGADSGKIGIIYDDFAQRKDTPGAPNPEIMEVIQLINIAPYMLHMAAMEDKGKVFANYKAMILTSNVAYPEVDIADPQAFYRRIEECHVWVRVKREYALESGRLDYHKAARDNPIKDVDGNPVQINPFVYEFCVYPNGRTPLDMPINGDGYPRIEVVNGIPRNNRRIVYDFASFRTLLHREYLAKQSKSIAIANSIPAIARYLVENQGPYDWLHSFKQYFAKSLTYRVPTNPVVFHDCSDPLQYCADYVMGKCAFEPSFTREYLETIVSDTYREEDFDIIDAYLSQGVVPTTVFETDILESVHLFRGGFLTPFLGSHPAITKLIDFIIFCDICSKQARNLEALTLTPQVISDSYSILFETSCDQATIASLLPRLFQIYSSLLKAGLFVASPMSCLASALGSDSWLSHIHTILSAVSIAGLRFTSEEAFIIHRVVTSARMPVSPVVTSTVICSLYRQKPDRFVDHIVRKHNMSRDEVKEFMDDVCSTSLDSALSRLVSRGRDPTLFKKICFERYIPGIDSDLLPSTSAYSYWTAVCDRFWSTFSWESYFAAHSSSLAYFYTFFGWLVEGASTFGIVFGVVAAALGLKYVAEKVFSVDGEGPKTAHSYLSSIRTPTTPPEEDENLSTSNVVFESVNTRLKKQSRVVLESSNSRQKKQPRLTLESQVDAPSVSLPNPAAPPLVTSDGRVSYLNTTVLAESQPDESAYSLFSNAVIHNLYSLRDSDNTVSINMWFIVGTTLLTYRHCLPYIKDAFENPNKYKLYDVDRRNVIPFNMTTVKSIRSADIQGHPTDILLVSLDDKIVSARRKILHHFVTSDELATCDSTPGSLVGSRLYNSVPYISCLSNFELMLSTHHKVKKRPLPFVDADGDEQIPSYKFVDHNDNSVTIELASSISYYANTAPGDCGSLVVVLNSRLRHKFCGMHVAGHNYTISGSLKGVGYSVPITQERLNKCMSGIDVRFLVCPVISDVDSCLPIVPQGAYIPIGVSVGEDGPLSSGRVMTHDFKPSPISGVLQEPIMKPSNLYKHGDEDITIKNMSGAENPVCMDPVILTEAAEEVHQVYTNVALECYANNLITADDFIPFKPFHVALKGDSKYIKPLVLSTSPGVPWTSLKDGQPGKRNFVSEDGVPSDVLFNAVVDACLELRSGKRIPCLWADLAKSERRPIEKVDAGKTRMITSAPLHVTIICKILYGSSMVRQFAGRIKNTSSLGTNVYSYQDGHGLGDYIFKFPNIGATDFKRYDKTTSHQGLRQNEESARNSEIRLAESFCDIACPLIVESYSSWPEFSRRFMSLVFPEYDFSVITPVQLFEFSCECLRMRDFLHRDIASSVHILGNTLYLDTQGMPSGVLITGKGNTEDNFMGFRYCWKRLVPSHMRKSFDDHVRCNFQGDDNVFTVSDEAAPYFNCVTLQSAFRDIGRDMTDALKTDGQIQPFQSFEDTWYLKRTPRISTTQPGCSLESSRYVWCLDKSVIQEMPNWVTKSGPTKVMVSQILEDVLREACLWGEYYYNSVYDKLFSKCARINIKLPSRDFRGTRAGVLSGSFSPWY